LDWSSISLGDARLIEPTMKILHNRLALIGALILLLIGIGCNRHTNETSLQPNQSTEKSSPQLVDVTEAKRLIAAREVTNFDVRTPDEFSAGHIAGAKNLNFYDGDFEARLPQLDKSQSYLVHCASGRQSAQAGAVMSHLGFATSKLAPLME
jgi:rhodanese-related sulfurtransferase